MYRINNLGPYKIQLPMTFPFLMHFFRALRYTGQNCHSFLPHELFIAKAACYGNLVPRVSLLNWCYGSYFLQPLIRIATRFFNMSSTKARFGGAVVVKKSQMKLQSYHDRTRLANAATKSGIINVLIPLCISLPKLPVFIGDRNISKKDQF